MKYNNEILDKVSILNAALEELSRQSIFENPDFAIDEVSSEFYLKLQFNKKSTHPELCIILSSFEIQIDIDRVNEAFVWSDKQIRENKRTIKNFIKMLFTSTIKVKYCGLHYTKLYFFDDRGHCIKTLKYITGLYLKIGCKTKEYQPIYNK